MSKPKLWDVPCFITGFNGSSFLFPSMLNLILICNFWSHQHHFLCTRNIDFSLLWSNSVNSCYFNVAQKSTHHLSVKSQQSAFAQWPEGEKWQRGDMETQSRWQQGARTTARTGGTSSLPTPPTKYQSPEVTSTRKRLKTNQPSLPLPGGFVPGMGEGCWKVDLVLSPSTHHRPLSVPWLRVWRWERRECFRRLTHHIQAQSHRPSWAPDGHVGLRSWWARWLAHASYPWCSRHWSPRFHHRPRKRKKERQRGRKRREAGQRVKITGEEGRKG